MLVLASVTACRAGVPNPQASDWYWVHGLLGTRPHSRGERRASERSFICCSPSLALPPEPSPSPRGKIVFHETGPSCQKVWGPPLQTMGLFFLHAYQKLFQLYLQNSHVYEWGFHLESLCQHAISLQGDSTPQAELLEVSVLKSQILSRYAFHSSAGTELCGVWFTSV